jgi:hypothetical protein
MMTVARRSKKERTSGREETVKELVKSEQRVSEGECSFVEKERR